MALSVLPHRYLHNRAEHAHHPTRQRERRMQGFQSPEQASGSSPRMVRSSTTTDHDAISSLPPHIAQSWANISRSGKKSRGLYQPKGSDTDEDMTLLA